MQPFSCGETPVCLYAAFQASGLGVISDALSATNRGTKLGLNFSKGQAAKRSAIGLGFHKGFHIFFDRHPSAALPIRTIIGYLNANILSSAL